VKDDKNFPEKETHRKIVGAGFGNERIFSLICHYSYAAMVSRQYYFGYYFFQTLSGLERALLC